MVVERSTGATSTWTDVFDRVLDKGIVIDAWQRVALSLGGIDLVTVKARIVVVSIETYLKTRGGPHPALPMSPPTLSQESDARDRHKRAGRRP